MIRTGQKEIVLIKSASYSKKMHPLKKYAFFALFLLLILLPIGYFFWRIGPDKLKDLDFDKLRHFDWADFLREIAIDIWRDPSSFLAPLILFFLHFGSYLFHKRERLIVNDHGIHYQSHLPPMLQFIKRDWQVRWSEIREIRTKRLKIFHHLAYTILEIDTGMKCFKFIPMQWLDPEDPAAEQYSFRKLQKTRQPEQLNLLWQSHPLIHYLEKAGLSPQLIPKAKTVYSGFDLNKNVHTLTAVCLILFFLFYSIVDLAANTEVYAVRPFYETYLLIAVVAAVLSWRWQKSAKAPLVVTLALSFMLGAGVGFASYPGALRLNQITDRQGLQSYDYQMQADYSFIPEKSDLPVLVFPKDRYYWSQYPKGYRYQFRLRKGGLNFYQIDMAPVFDKFRQDQKNKKVN